MERVDDRPFRVGFVTGATPDKWAAVWRQRRPGDPLELVQITEDEQDARLRDGSLDMALVRLPVDRDGLHCIPLYVERAVVVAAREHVVSAYDEVPSGDLAHEQFALPPPDGIEVLAEQLAFPPMSQRDAIEVAASGTAVVVVPMSVARLFHRKDVVHRPVADLEGTTIGLAWSVDNEDPRVQAFIGIVRGRTERSSRG
ncbi:MAG: LysR family substrate-binding domain-containing protein [Nocardioidaceae bacterium]